MVHQNDRDERDYETRLLSDVENVAGGDSISIESRDWIGQQHPADPRKYSRKSAAATKWPGRRYLRDRVQAAAKTLSLLVYCFSGSCQVSIRPQMAPGASISRLDHSIPNAETWTIAAVYRPSSTPEADMSPPRYHCQQGLTPRLSTILRVIDPSQSKRNAAWTSSHMPIHSASHYAPFGPHAWLMKPSPLPAAGWEPR
ncbi:hypothetical protein LZ32DRAFT_620481 [Colletotrichum eremochloae]|nr:hypothetical protein LZ32DRAFT_620481 [Colletotrichum eremochloae]